MPRIEAMVVEVCHDRACTRRAVLLLLSALFFQAFPVFALDPAKSIDQYGHEEWTAQEDLPGESVYQILQGLEGYLWLRTSAGLVRFDGLRFVLMDITVNGVSVNEPVKAICMGADGQLLVRTTTRTLTYRHGDFLDYRPPAPLPDGEIRNLFESREHEVFIASDDFIYLIPKGLPRLLRRHTGWVGTMTQEKGGPVWIGGAREIYTYRDGQLSVVASLPKTGATITLSADDTTVWLGTFGGLFDVTRGRLEPVAARAIPGEVNTVLRDRHGNLWVGTTSSGLLCLKGNKVLSFDRTDGLTDRKVLSLFEDREGSLWVGTSGGLDRFKDTKLTTITSRQGLPSDQTSMVLQARDGSIYVMCLGGGLGRIKNGAITTIAAREGLRSFYGNGLFEGRDGSLWFGGNHLLERHKDGRFTQHRAPQLDNDISAVSEDEESLIVATAETMVYRYKDGRAWPFTFEGKTTPLSLPGNYTFTIYRGPDGTLWFGTVKGLFKFAAGSPPENAWQRQVNFPVTSISDDQRGNLWLGGRVPGLTRFRIADGQVTRYRKKDGLFDDYPSRALSDDKGNLWVSTASGITSVSEKDLDDFADGRIPVVHSTTYDIADGMRTGEASSPTSQPGGVRGHDGKLWFTTQKGLVVVDPARIPRNQLIPPVVIEELSLDGLRSPIRHSIFAPSGTSRFEFHYTALTFLTPARVRFKYRLEGYERDWISAGARRVATYTNLPPGNYLFHVIAANDDGLWNTKGDLISFTLQPHFYQTSWFYLLCVWVVSVSLYAVLRWNTTRLRNAAKELGRLVAERTQDLQSQKNFLRQVIDIIPNFVFVRDREGRFTLVNRALAELFGVSPDQTVGKTGVELGLDAAESESYHRADLDVLATGQEKIIPIEKNTGPDGKVRWLQTAKRPLLDEKGKATHVLGVATDITHRKQIEEELVRAKEAAEAASRAKSEFLANMSHEIRTPMNGIIGMAELAVSAEPVEQKEFLALMRSSADALLVILNDILDYSKIEAGKITFDPAPFNLRELVADSVKSMALPAHNKGLELVYSVQSDVPVLVVADSVRLRQVLLNLVGNAIKFTHSGEVEIRVKAEKLTLGGLEFSVRDTGIGIAAGNQKKLFQAFEQGDSSTTRQFGGTGLGLAISSRIVRLMGGEIWIESAPGAGSVFRFTIPLANDAVGESSRVVPDQTLCGVRILIVDDNATSRRALCELTCSWQMRPEQAASGPEAIAMLKRAAEEAAPFRLMLLDQKMPGMDGFEVFRRTVEVPTTTLMMLNYPDQRTNAMLCRELHVDAFLVKPICQDDLLVEIHRLLGRPLAESVTTSLPLSSRRVQRPLRILVAEDSPVNQKLATTMLKRMGHDVVVAATGSETIDLWQHQHFDLILMDVQMPEVDGLEATRRIRQTEKPFGDHIPIIAMTAHAMQGDRSHCLEAGMDDYIAKPVSRKMLEEVVQRHSAPLRVKLP